MTIPASMRSPSARGQVAATVQGTSMKLYKDGDVVSSRDDGEARLAHARESLARRRLVGVWPRILPGRNQVDAIWNEVAGLYALGDACPSPRYERRRRPAPTSRKPFVILAALGGSVIEAKLDKKTVPVVLCPARLGDVMAQSSTSRPACDAGTTTCASSTSATATHATLTASKRACLTTAAFPVSSGGHRQCTPS